MKIAITSQNRREITGHTGMCRKFWIYDVAEDPSEEKIQGKKLLELPKEQSLHEHRGNSHPVLDNIQVLISAGMGEGMWRRLAGLGIRAIVTRETDPDKAVQALLDGSLVEETAGCSDHHHEHGHQEVKIFPGIS
uniref:Predicted Fe-Mo cluster-binding protein, NifX family n=1 Tax=Candidatus Kentrum sp. FW TaxID=2126338 RepID=A0A450SMA7_9GAMM|nr:MAG: Predicted Fe-Mo cluster-binding protein, NifX family [Candidatus Kentron sp. FW]